MVRKARASKLAILSTLALVGCSGPPGRDSELLLAADADYAPRVATTHAGASYTLDGDGVIRDASGAALASVPALELGSYTRSLRAVGPTSFWVTNFGTVSLVVDGAVTNHAPLAGVSEDDLSVDGIDARSATDAWVVADAVGVGVPRLCHFDGVEWACELLPETTLIGAWTVALVGDEVFVEDPDMSVYRRTGVGTYEPIASGGHEGLAELTPIGSGLAVVYGVDEARSPEALYLLGADGALTQIRSEAEPFSYPVIAGPDGGLWFVTQDQHLDEDCTLLGSCTYTSTWRQYVVWRYRDGVLVEVGHVDIQTPRDTDGPADDVVLVPDGDGALLFAEGAWRTP